MIWGVGTCSKIRGIYVVAVTGVWGEESRCGLTWKKSRKKVGLPIDCLE